MKDTIVMAIDDDPLNLDLIKSHLSEEPVKYFSFSNPVEAVEKMQEVSPDILLLDRVMPEMDGHEVLKAMLDNQNFKNIPVVMITSKAGIKDINESLRLGAVDYIVKPFDGDNLRLRIKRVLGKF